MMELEKLISEETDDNVMSGKEIFEGIENMFDSVFSTKKYKTITVVVLMATQLLLQDNIPNNIIVDNSLPSIELPIPAMEAKGKLRVVEESVDRIRLSEELSNLAKIEDGWDNQCAKRPTRLALHNASILLAGLDDAVLPKCSFFPSNDAGIYFQGHLNNGKLTVFLNDEKMAYVVKGGTEKLTASVTLNRKSVEYLNVGLKRYV